MKMTEDVDNYCLYPDSPDTTELFQRQVFTAEDRYKLLESRDKILRDRIPKRKLHGYCLDMCPEKERYKRDYWRTLQPYEISLNQDKVEYHQFAIKAYSESSPGQEEPLTHDMYRRVVNFMLDRIRAIRKDIRLQQMCNSEALSLIEKFTRFHIHCCSRLCELDRLSFDSKLNDDYIIKCLEILEDLYSGLKFTNAECPNEHEFVSYQILMNFHNRAKCDIQQKNVSLESLQVQQAIKLQECFHSKDFYSFFETVQDLPYLAACIVHRYFFQVRSEAFKSLIESHSPRKSQESWIRASSLQRVLGYGVTEKDKFISLCNAHGCIFEEEFDKIILPQTFRKPELTSICRETNLIESKMETTVSEVINGGPLSPCPSHSPQCSFNQEGYLIPGPIISLKPRFPSGKTFPEISSKSSIDPSPSLSSESQGRITVSQDFPATNECEKSVRGASVTSSSIPSQLNAILKVSNITSEEFCSKNSLQEYRVSTVGSSQSSESNFYEDVPQVAVSIPTVQRSLLRVKTKAEKKIMPEINLPTKKCTTCDKSFKNNSELNRHSKIHSGDKPFDCTICKKSFVQKSQLEQHKIIHLGTKPFSCATCDKKFSRNSDLAKHGRIHRHEKPYECEDCKKCFTQKGELIVHKRTHTNERPFQCNTCGKAFKSSSHLTRHNKIHSGKTTVAPTAAAAT